MTDGDALTLHDARPDAKTHRLLELVLVEVRELRELLEHREHVSIAQRLHVRVALWKREWASTLILGTSRRERTLHHRTTQNGPENGGNSPFW